MTEPAMFHGNGTHANATHATANATTPTGRTSAPGVTRFPNSAYAGLVSCLSAEWQYICRTVPDVGPLLAPVEQALRTKFLPAITGISGPITD